MGVVLKQKWFEAFVLVACVAACSDASHAPAPPVGGAGSGGPRPVIVRDRRKFERWYRRSGRHRWYRGPAGSSFAGGGAFGGGAASFGGSAAAGNVGEAGSISGSFSQAGGSGTSFGGSDGVAGSL